MKKVLLTMSLVLLAGSASAHGFYGGYHGGYYRAPYYGAGNWVAPALIGGVIGYELSRPRPVIVEQPPVVVQQQPVIVQQNQNCTPWTETQHPDGTITRTRTCNQ
jgi:hypothetical protein